MTEVLCPDCGHPIAAHSLVGCSFNRPISKPPRKRFRKINKMRTQKKKMLKSVKRKDQP